MKKALAMLLSITTVATLFVTPVSAAETNSVLSEKQTNNIEVLNDTSILVESQGESELVSVAEDDSTRTVTIKNTKTGEEDYLKYDKSSNTIYSSITGKTINLNNSEISGGISPDSVSSYSFEYISYSDIRNALGTTFTVAGFVALVVTKVPAAEFASGVLTKIGEICTAGGFGSLAIPNDSNHGIKLRIKTVKYYRTRMGRRQVYKITHQVMSVSTY